MAKKAADLTDDEINAELGKLVPAHKLSDSDLDAELAKLTGRQAAAAPADIPSGPKTSKSATALESFGKGLTANYLPNIQAMAEPITDRAFSLLTGKKVDAAPLSQVTGLTKEYAASRDQNIGRQALQQQEHPGVALAGNLAGNVVAGIAASGALPAAETFAGRAAQGVGAGLAQAGLSNPGQAPGEIALAQPGERIANVIQAAPYAIGGTLAAEAIPGSVNALKDFVKSKAEKAAFKAVGPYAREAMQAFDKGTVNSMGRTLLDEGVVGGLPKSYETLAAKAEEATSKAGKEIDRIVNNLDEFGKSKNIGIDKEPLAHKLRERLISRSGVPGVGSDNNLYNDLIDEFLQTGNKTLGLKEAQNLKTAVGQQINWNKLPGADIQPKELFYRTLYHELNDQTNKVAEDLATATSNAVKDEFLQAKKAYGNLKTASKISGKRASKEFANRLLSPSDYYAAGTGALLGQGENLNPTFSGLALGTVNRLGRKYGNQAIASGFDAAGNALGRVQGALQPIRQNPIATQAIIQNLINESPLQRRLNRTQGK